MLNKLNFLWYGLLIAATSGQAATYNAQENYDAIAEGFEGHAHKIHKSQRQSVLNSINQHLKKRLENAEPQEWKGLSVTQRRVRYAIEGLQDCLVNRVLTLVGLV